ncbi:DUF402 domain-containing protein [Cohnella sp. CFH 77786]|uniref:DUF402 domain-containing protein n=1 Tax=Cohnella sp. CFH 77786 TaxID=2662265 RepID=UPI001C608310|nr:DUF402 domain-containing protein [Cohnella sp. CFH 77786]MBW5445618.1 DUF402 domain-containing protein [Cohnella sp. CFH 77786]
MEQNGTERSDYRRGIIKSFKHDGSLHRIWLENWLVPAERLHPDHVKASLQVLLNEGTPIREADGRTWISRVPAAAFFLPGEWFNVVALLEERGVRYYCNAASPYYHYRDVWTYIDYDLDLVMHPDGSLQELDRDEFNRHRAEYRYDAKVLSRIEWGLGRLRNRMAGRSVPFGDELVRRYYEDWKSTMTQRRRDRP